MRILISTGRSFGMRQSAIFPNYHDRSLKSSRSSFRNPTPAEASNAGVFGGGEGGIRTLVRVSPKHAFQACAFNHSAISPGALGCFSSLTHAKKIIPNSQIPFRLGRWRSIAAAEQSPQFTFRSSPPGQSDILLRVAEPQTRDREPLASVRLG